MTSNDYPENLLGYNSYVIDIGHHQDLRSAQPVKVEI